MRTLLLLLCLFAAPLHAATESFTISSQQLPALPPTAAEPPPLFERLQQQAVRNYLHRVLRDRFSLYESQITNKFAEDYIAYSQITKQSADGTQMEIEVTLNTSGLDQWVRTNETKAAGSTTLRPAFFFSSSVPGFAFDARQTAMAVKQAGAGQTVFRAMQSAFQKFNTSLTPQDELFAGTRAPTNEGQISSLRSAAGAQGYNAAVWANLAPCPRCGTRLEIFLYNLPQARIVQSFRVDLPLSASELSDGSRLSKEANKTFQEFTQGMEESVSRGTLFATEYRVTVEGLKSRPYKQVDAALGKQSWILLSSFSRGTAGSAEFKVLSTLPARDFAQRFQNAQFPGMTLRLTGFDNQGVALRYLQ
ncbi:hypothetical protein K2X33_07390 [bacterium]|nr:hypothetical protein [bacterium]